MSGAGPTPKYSLYPMLWLAASFASGILIAERMPVGLAVWLPATLALAVAATIFNKYRFAAFLLAAAFVSGGGLVSLCETRQNTASDRIRTIYESGEIASGDPVSVEGVIASRPEPSADGEFLTLRAESIRYHGSERPVTGNVRVFVPSADNGDGSEISDLRYGSLVRAVCKLERKDEYLNPGVTPRKLLLDREGIDATATLKSPRLIEHLGEESVILPLAWAYDLRAAMIASFEKNLDQRSAGVLAASMLGDKYYLDKDTADLFREGATFHFLIIAGLHITFIGGVMLLIVRLFTRNRWAIFLVTTSALWAYALAVGAHLPVMRATLMFTSVMFSHVIYRRGTILNALGAVALVLLVWKPSDLFDPSFQLTIVSVMAIVSASFPLIDKLRRIGAWTPTTTEPFPPNVPGWLVRGCQTLYWRPEVWDRERNRQIWSANISKSPYLAVYVVGNIQRFARYAIEGIVVSLIAQICLLPLSVVYFHRVSVSGIVLNIWVGIFLAAESLTAIAGVVLNGVSSLMALPVFKLVEVINWLLLSLPRLFSYANWTSFRLPAYSGPGRAVYFLYFIPVIILVVAANRWDPFSIKSEPFAVRRSYIYPAIAGLAFCGAVIIFHPFSAPRPDGRLHIDLLDVGQGDSALVTFPDGTTLLIDGGGRHKYRKGQQRNEGQTEAVEPDTRGIGEAVVSEVLWFKGYSRIDYMLATHADADHIQGLGDVARNFGLRQAWFARMPARNEEFAKVADVLRARGVPSMLIARGDTFDFGRATVAVLSPEYDDSPESPSDNDHSAALMISYGGRKFLLTGDIERPAESSMLAAGETLEADLIKVPHHGSRTSSTQAFVDAVHPQIAVISVGRTSPFGHPHRDVVERWRAAGAGVMTTGERGMISVSTDGTDLEIERFGPE